MIQQVNAEDEIVVRVITGYISAEDLYPVEVVVSGLTYETQKAIELIKAAPQLYDALVAVSQFLHSCPNDGTDEAFNALLLQIERAEAAARGGVLQRDRRMAIHG